MPKPKLKKPQLSFRIMVRLSDPQRRQLAAAAVKKGTTESGLMRMWVVERLQQEKG